MKPRSLTASSHPHRRLFLWRHDHRVRRQRIPGCFRAYNRTRIVQQETVVMTSEQPFLLPLVPYYLCCVGLLLVLLRAVYTAGARPAFSRDVLLIVLLAAPAVLVHIIHARTVFEFGWWLFIAAICLTLRFRNQVANAIDAFIEHLHRSGTRLFSVFRWTQPRRHARDLRRTCHGVPAQTSSTTQKGLRPEATEERT